MGKVVRSLFPSLRLSLWVSVIMVAQFCFAYRQLCDRIFMTVLPVSRQHVLSLSHQALISCWGVNLSGGKGVCVHTTDLFCNFIDTIVNAFHLVTLVSLHHPVFTSFPLYLSVCRHSFSLSVFVFVGLFRCVCLSVFVSPFPPNCILLSI